MTAGLPKIGDNREGAKNSGGKTAGLLPAPGNTGKRQGDQPVVLAE